MNKQDLILRTQELLLRPFEKDDIDLVFYGLSHPEVIRYYGVSFQTREATREQMNWFDDLRDHEKGNWWAICSAGNHEFYGAAGLNNWNHEFRKVEIGFWLLPEHWGKGIIPAAVPAICGYAFDKMNIHRVEAFVESENINSQKVLKKLGFVLEGTMKDCEVKNGEFISLDIYACFNPRQQSPDQ